MQRQLVRAKSLVELASAARSLPQARRPLSEVLPQLPLPVAASFIVRALRADAAVDVGTFLSRRELHRRLDNVIAEAALLKAFKGWLLGTGDGRADATATPLDDGSAEGPPRGPAAPPGVRPDEELPDAAASERLERAELRLQLEDLRIPGLLEWPAALLNGDVRAPHRSEPLGRLLDPSAPSLGPILPVLRGTIARFRERALQCRAAAGGTELELQLLLEDLDASSATGRLARAVVAERLACLDDYPRRLVPLYVALRVDGDALVADVRSIWPELHVDVRFDGFGSWAAHRRQRCPCGGPGCVHRAAALDELLRALATPGSPAAEVVALALTPPWRRALHPLLHPTLEGPRTAAKEKPGTLHFEFVLDSSYGSSGGERALRCVVWFHLARKRGPPGKGTLVHEVGKYLGRVHGHDRRLLERLALAEADANGRLRVRGFQHSSLFGDALLELSGHPHVTYPGEDHPARTAPLAVEVVPPTLSVEESNESVRVEFRAGGARLPGNQRGIPTSGGELHALPLDDRLLLIPVPAAMAQLLRSLARHGAALPPEALPTLAAALPAHEAGVQLELPEALRGDEVEPRNRPIVRVGRSPQGISLELVVEPLPGGPVFPPGHGAIVSATFDGRRRTFTRRLFERELEEAGKVQATLGLDAAAAVSPWCWALPGGGASVEVLRRLAAFDAQAVGVEWRTAPPRFRRAASLADLRLGVEARGGRYWLGGDVRSDDGRFALALLLEAARARRHWVQLGESDFAQLSDELLDAVAPLAHLPAGEGGTEVGLAQVPLVHALEGKAETIELAPAWQAMTARLAAAETLEIPPPTGVTASLRPYQREGYEWMSRLAAWGAGACLADDMGLGKTLQALAVLASRASLGPALVVAPSSVLHTWRSEAERWTPGLRLALFHEGDRRLERLGPSDVVVVSWSLLARDPEPFAATRFATVVLDEAHAVKNADTRRARAAHALQGDFVIALTGTPIENHLGELWSLFRAVMPTLLSTEASFAARFGSGSREALAALAAQVRPFVLRRLKSQVATELPPKTELDLVVPLSPEERALYDDVRLSALANLGERGPEGQRFELLAALTRLRLAACHPRLVDRGWQGPASKLARLLELLQDLLASKHRVLVFSQFVQHLSLVREALDAAGVAYSTLDGSLAPSVRQRRVDDFQGGHGGDVFVISLKAGGTGLTLTAADYVVHLDPWWNPAVEDQASDRAHRLGQTKPVTVYRLIAEDTIEQSILALHRAKREVVDALLEGTDAPGKLSVADLAALVRGSVAEAQPEPRPGAL